MKRRLALVALALAVAASLAGCGIAQPWPTITATPGHHEVLLFGDSLFTGTGVFVGPVLQANGIDATVVDGHVNGSGPLDPINGHSPLDELKAQLAAHPDVDTIVFEYVGNCGEPCRPTSDGGGGLEFGSQPFYDAWRAGAHTLIDYARASSAVNGHGPYTVVWSISPPVRIDPTGLTFDPRLGTVARALSAMDLFDLVPAAGHGADWWTALSDTNGNYQQFLYYGGAVHQVRLDDQLHLTWDGAFRAATWTALGLRQAWAAGG